MKKNDIALLVDSCMDVPKIFLKKAGIYEIPLKVIYKDKIYTDKVDITAEEVYERLAEEIPKTSLPEGEDILRILQQILEDGYQKVIICTISSGLSGTNNMLNMMARDFKDLESYVLDTKNIGIGSGLQGVHAYHLIKKGLPFDEIIQILEKNVLDTKVFFSIPTLEYLKKGGRIGLVSSILGTALNLNPVISCNSDGVYHTVGKTRGRKKSIEKMLRLVEEFIENYHSYDIGISYGNCLEDAKQLAEEVKQRFPDIREFFMDEASPVLGVHTGPGLLGMAICRHHS